MKTVGLLGAGNVADIYMHNLSRLRNVRVAAVASRDPASTEARARAWGIDAETPASLLRRSDVDIVLNLTPPAAHLATTSAALEAGKHVYSEKPIGISLAESELLSELALRRGLRLAVGPDSMLGAGFQKARAMIDAGAIGRPLMATASILYHGADDWHPNPAFFYLAGGGPVHDVAPYFLTALIVLLGPIESIASTGSRGFETRTFTAEGREKGMTAPVEVLTTVLALATFRSGVRASLMTSWDVWRTSQPDIEIHGTEGSLSLPHPNWHGGPLKYARPGGDWQDVPLDDEPLAELNWPVERPERANHRGVGIGEMIEAMEEGVPHRTSADLATHVVEAADAMVNAAGSGAAISLSGEPVRPPPFTADDAVRLFKDKNHAPRTG